VTDVLPTAPSFSGDEVLDRVVSFIESYEEEFAVEWLRIATEEGGELGNLIAEFIAGDISVEELYDRAQAVQWDLDVMNEMLQDAFWGGGAATAAGVGLPNPRLTVGWEESNPWVQESFRDIQTRLVAASQATNDGVATVVAQGVRDSWRREEIVREIYNQVGLLPSHVVAVDKYRTQLINSGASGFQITQQVEAYAKRLRNYRAKMIARTEVSSAVNAGQHEYWRRVEATGMLPPRTMRVWITAYDERVCPECGPLNRSEAAIGSTWLSNKGQQIVHPPAHPHCRCTTGLVFHDEFGKLDPYPTLMPLEKHEGGGHDQSSHSNWANGGGELPRPDWDAPAEFKDRIGKCYELAWDCAVQAKATLVHGSIEGMGNPRIAHAWAKTAEGNVYDPVMDQVFTPEDHKTFFKAETAEEYADWEISSMSRRFLHKGPWHKAPYGTDWYDEVESLNDIAKHYGGGHDQKSHGSWARGGYSTKVGELTDTTDPTIHVKDLRKLANGSGISREIALQHAKELFELSISGDHQPRIEVEVTMASPNPDRTISVYGKVNFGNEGEVVIGDFTRTLHYLEGDAPPSPYVQMQYFNMKEEFQDQGIGSALVRHWEDQFARAGYERMETRATSLGQLFNGGYTWMRQGYDFLRPEEAVSRLAADWGWKATHPIGREPLDAPGLDNTLKGFKKWKREHRPQSPTEMSEIIRRDLGDEAQESFHQYLREDGVWYGTKPTQMIDRDRDGYVNDGTDEEQFVGKGTHPDWSKMTVVQVANWWMDNEPVEFEADTREVREALGVAARAALESRLSKHATHDQKTHGNWATGVGRLNVATPGSGKKGDYNRASEYRSDHASAAKRDPKWEAKVLGRVQELAGFGNVTDLEEAVALMEHNIEQSFLRGITNPDSEQWRSWYPLGNEFGETLAIEAGVHPDIAYGIIARLSPQCDWDANMVMAAEVMRVLSTNPVLTEEMAASANSLLDDVNGRRKQPAGEGELPDITAGKRVSDLSPEAAAHVIRSISQDEGVTLPGGASFRWQSEYNMARSVEMFRAGKTEDYTAVDDLMGVDMKIRSFYNNLRDPFDADFGELTVDTHAAGIAIGIPVTTSSREIDTKLDRNALLSYDGTRGRLSSLSILGTPSSVSAGVKGAYPLIADAYRNVAARHGVLPREVQSVTWEQHRLDWPPVARKHWALDVTRGIHHELGHGPEADAAIEEFRSQMPGVAPLGEGAGKPESVTGGATRWANQYGQGYVWGEDERED